MALGDKKMQKTNTGIELNKKSSNKTTNLEIMQNIYEIEFSKITKRVSNKYKIDNIDLLFKSGDISAIFANDPKVESTLASVIAGAVYSDKGVITISKNLDPRYDFLYVDSNSGLPRGLSDDFFRKFVSDSILVNKDNNKSDMANNSEKLDSNGSLIVEGEVVDSELDNTNLSTEVKDISEIESKSKTKLKLCNIWKNKIKGFKKAKSSSFDESKLSYVQSVLTNKDNKTQYKLLVFDNPTENLPMSKRAVYWQEVKSFLKHNRDIIVVIVSSDFDEIESIINRVIILQDDSSIIDKSISAFTKKGQTLKERVIHEIS
ncbi:MAG: hypothetical protein LBT99_03645 [Bifidobacteriaceae bacterium]|jgi:ABC-type sugar transport system ATPase subunit|nr:hypothetical protein [Bifidobacteriaceae bacterium]